MLETDSNLKCANENRVHNRGANFGCKVNEVLTLYSVNEARASLSLCLCVRAQVHVCVSLWVFTFCQRSDVFVQVITGH